MSLSETRKAYYPGMGLKEEGWDMTIGIDIAASLGKCPATKWEKNHTLNAKYICDHCGVHFEIPDPLPLEEYDPNGTDAHSPGAKLDAGKVYADLVMGDFAHALEEVCKIGTFGANKYTKSGWVSVPDGIDRYSDAMLRHWLKHKQGELIDPDSGELHLAHMAWNMLAVLQLFLRTPDENKDSCKPTQH